MEVFARCINHSYKIQGKDLSNPHSKEYGFEIYKELDSLSQIVIHNIIQDSIANTYKLWEDVNWGTDSIYINNLYSEGILGSKTLKFCLDYHLSSELDSITTDMSCRIEEAWRNFGK